MSITLILFALSTSLLPLNVVAATSVVDSSNLTRLGGYDRFGTAVEIAENGWTNATSAILAPAGDNNMIYALASASLSKAIDGPVLLSDKDSLTPETLAELKKLGVIKVYIISGTEAISDLVETQLTVAGITTIRLGGNDRFETVVNIAKELQKIKPFSEVAIVNGYSSADAISIGAIAASRGMPILAVDKNSIPTPVSDFIKSVNITNSYVIGGTAVVSDTVKKLLPSAERISGNDRYATNREVLKRFADTIVCGTLFFANGNDSSLVDSITGAPMASKFGGAIVLSGKEEVPELTKSLIKSSLSIKNPGILGGTTVMSDSAVMALLYKTSPTTQSGSVNLVTEGAILQDKTIDGSIILSANNQTLKNVTVNGVVFIDPGVDGTATLDNVNAKKIVVLSGALSGINLKETKADKLIVASNSSNTHIKVDGLTVLGSTAVQSNCTIEALEDSKVGDMIIKSTQNKQVNVVLSGIFTNPVLIRGSVQLTSYLGTILPVVKVSNEDSATSISVGGRFTNVSITDNSSLTLTYGNIIALDAVGSSRIVVNARAEISSLTSSSNLTTATGEGIINNKKATAAMIPVSSNPYVDGNTISNSAKALLSFGFSGIATGVISETSHTVHVTVPYNADITKLTPYATVSKGAVVTSNYLVEQSFSLPVTIYVTAQNGTKRSYVITVDKENISAGRDINSFKISFWPKPGAIVSISGNTIAVTVPYGTDVTALAPIITTSPYATISPSSGKALDFTSPVTYIVTSQNGVQKTYIVTVTVLNK